MANSNDNTTHNAPAAGGNEYTPTGGSGTAFNPAVDNAARAAITPEKINAIENMSSKNLGVDDLKHHYSNTHLGKKGTYSHEDAVQGGTLGNVNFQGSKISDNAVGNVERLQTDGDSNNANPFDGSGYGAYSPANAVRNQGAAADSADANASTGNASSAADDDAADGNAQVVPNRIDPTASSEAATQPASTAGETTGAAAETSGAAEDTTSDATTITPPPIASGTTPESSGETTGTTPSSGSSGETSISAPTLSMSSVSGAEDTAISLNISASTTNPSDTMQIVISGMPNGAVLSAGTNNGDGSWTLESGDLSGLTITPPANSDDDFALTVTATATDGSDTAQSVGTINVSVAADADAPTLVVNNASGTEDTAIALDISAALVDTDGSESLSIVISGVPSGAVLSAGTNNGDGSWTLESGDLSGLTITPPANSDDDFELTVTATATDGSDTAETVGTINVSVAADADAPTLVVNNASGTEDTAIALDISAALVDTDGSESLSIVVSGVPNGAVLSAGTNNGDGSWTLESGDLSGLTITPPANSDDDFALTVTAISSDDSDTAQSVGTINVSVAADADAPTLVVNNASGTEDTAIALDISAALVDTDGSESLSIVISGVPSGAVLSAGTNNGDGSWTLESGDLSGLTITPPANSDDDFALTVTAISSDDSDTAQSVGTINVSVAADADAPTLVVNNASGTEDTAIALDISAALVDTDGSESLSIVISGVPSGAVLSAGTNNGDGSWTLESGDLSGLTITPPANSDNDFALTVTATATDGSDTAQSVGTINVSVAADADAPTLVVNNASGTEDTAIALDISAALVDTDGSESLSIVVSGVPSGAVLSAGTNNGDGSWTLEAGDLSGLTITPPANSDDDFALTVTATATDGSDTAQSVGTINVSVAADADAPTLVVNNASGTEDTAIALDISAALVDTDGSESLSIVISGVPSGAVLSAGTNNGDGSWTLEASDLSGLTITPPANSDDDFALTVTATATDGSDTAETVGTINVSVAADADAPTLVVNNASGTEDTAIALDINAALVDTDGSESLSIVISGVPNGAVLSAGTNNGDGSWTLEAGDLSGLTITPPANSDDDFALTVTATATDGSDTAETVGTINVSVAADADAPTLVVNNASGTEDTAIALDITAALVDTDGSESLSIVISDVPSGAVLSAGTNNGDGSWTLEAGDLSGLTITPPANSDNDFALTVTATATDGSDTAQSVGTINVSVAADADAPNLVVNNASGTEDTAIALDISAALVDTDGSESLSIVISGVPSGAVLSAGTNNGDGSWTLESGDLSGLTITPPANSDNDFALTVTATATDGSDTAQSVGTINVSVAADADAPTLVVNNASGTEDTAIALDISAALVDTDGSESLSIIISGVPSGAVLSAGTNNGDGSWTLESGDLSGLTITPPTNSDNDFALTVTATATDGSDTAETVGTINVSVAADADAPTLVVNNASGTEDTAIALDISAALVDTDGSESLSIVISGVPSGAVLSAGMNNGDGSWTLESGDLSGLTITPPANSDDDFALTVTAISSDDSDTAQSVGTINVSVAADADAPTLVVNNASGTEDTAIALDISAALVDTDGSESLSIVISGVPNGAVLSAGTNNGDGSWTLESGDLSGLTITPPANSDDDFALTVTATATDGSDTAQSVGTINVSVAADADMPSLTANNVSGDAGTSIDLDVSSLLADTDGSESLSVTFSGVPAVASLSAGTNNGDGTWTVDAEDLAGLQFNAPPDANTFNITATATATESENGDTATSPPIGFTITTTAACDDADTPNLYAWDVSGGVNAPIALPIHASLKDQDGSETLGIVISGIPLGAMFSNENGDLLIAINGQLSLTQDQLEGLEMTLPISLGPSVYDLTITATSTESIGGDTATTSETISVTTLDTTYQGLPTKDTATGGNGDDAMYGGGNKDTLTGGAGDDALYGGSDNDKLYGGDDDDSLFGGSGNDKLYGEDGNDILFGEEGDDALYGGAGEDVLFGGSGDDDLYGQDGNDYLFGGFGKDTVEGGAGDDVIFASENEGTVIGRDNTYETLQGDEGSDTFIFDQLYDQPAGYKVYGGSNGGSSGGGSGVGGAWTDTILLDVANEAPGNDGGAAGDGSWVLQTNDTYTINEETKTVTFDNPDASGTITLSDGSEINFNDIEEIKWS